MDDQQNNSSQQAPVNPGGELNVPLAQPPPLAKSKKPHKLLIILVVLFFIGLAAVTVFVIRKDDTKTNSANPATTGTQAKPATSVDVDQTSKEIDSTLQKADNVNDVNSADLTDSSLGL